MGKALECSRSARALCGDMRAMGELNQEHKDSDKNHQEEISKDESIAVNDADAARILGMSRKTLANWRSRGVGPIYLKYGGRQGAVRYTIADLKTWRNAQRHNRSVNNGETSNG